MCNYKLWEIYGRRAFRLLNWTKSQRIFDLEAERCCQKATDVKDAQNYSNESLCRQLASTVNSAIISIQEWLSLNLEHILIWWALFIFTLDLQNAWWYWYFSKYLSPFIMTIWRKALYRINWRILNCKHCELLNQVDVFFQKEETG